MCLKINLKKNIFISEEERVNCFGLYGNNLVYISRNEESTYIVNLKTNVKNRINKVLYGLVDNYYKENENFYDDKDEEKIYIYDLTSGNITKKFDNTIIGYPKLNTDKYIVTGKHFHTYIHIYDKNDFSLVWENNIRDFFNEEDSEDNQLRIQEIYAFKDNFIVVSTFGILSLNQQNGELIWKTDDYARTMEIVDMIVVDAKLSKTTGSSAGQKLAIDAATNKQSLAYKILKSRVVEEINETKLPSVIKTGQQIPIKGYYKLYGDGNKEFVNIIKLNKLCLKRKKKKTMYLRS